MKDRMFSLPLDVRREIWRRARFLSARDRVQAAWTRRPAIHRYCWSDPYDPAVCFLVAPQKLLVITEILASTKWSKRNGQWYVDYTRQHDYETIVCIQRHDDGIVTKLHVFAEDDVSLTYSSTLRWMWRSGYQTEYGSFQPCGPYWTYWASSIPEYMLKCLRGDLDDTDQAYAFKR